MKIVKTIEEVRNQVKEWRAQGLTVGLVRRWAICMRVMPV